MPGNEQLLPIAELDALCRSVELTWFGVLAAYGGFAKARLGPEDTDCVVEVFFVDESLEASIIRATYQDRKRLRRDLGCHVAIVCHSFADSISRYVEDISLLLAARPEGREFASANSSLTVTDRFVAVSTGGQVSVAAAPWPGFTCSAAYEIKADSWKTEAAAA